jgi:copper(I)-binding protein
MKFFSFLLIVFVLIGTLSCSSEHKPALNPEEKMQEFGVRPAAIGGNSAAYLTYTNEQEVADTLLSVQADFAGMSQVHESYKTEDGMMGMKERSLLIVEPDSALQFKQGGLHIMLMNLKEKLVPGDSVTVILHFSQAGDKTQKLPVLP